VKLYLYIFLGVVSGLLVLQARVYMVDSPRELVVEVSDLVNIREGHFQI
jgi:hypothetical protein